MRTPVPLTVDVRGELAARASTESPGASLTLVITPEAPIRGAYALVLRFDLDGPAPIFAPGEAAARMAALSVAGFGEGAAAPRVHGGLLIAWSDDPVGAGPERPLTLRIGEVRASMAAGVTRIEVAVHDFAPDIALIGDDPLAGEVPIASGAAQATVSAEGFSLSDLRVDAPVVRENRLADTWVRWNFAGPEGARGLLRLRADGPVTIDSVPLETGVTEEDAGTAIDLAAGGATFRELFSTATAMAAPAVQGVPLLRLELTVWPPGGGPRRAALHAEATVFLLQTDRWSRLSLEFQGCPAAIFEQPTARGEEDGTAPPAASCTLWGVFLPREAPGPARLMTSKDAGSRWRRTRTELPADVATTASVMLSHGRSGHGPHAWFVDGDQLTVESRRAGEAHVLALTEPTELVEAGVTGDRPPPLWGHRLIALDDDRALLLGGLDATFARNSGAWVVAADPKARSLDFQAVTVSPSAPATPQAPGLCFGAVHLDLGTRDAPDHTLFVLGGAGTLTGPPDADVRSLWRGALRLDAAGHRIVWDPEPYLDVAAPGETILAAELAVYEASRGTLLILATVLDEATGRVSNRREIVRADVAGHRRPSMIVTPPELEAGLGWRTIRQPHLLRAVVAETAAGGPPTILSWVLLDDPAFLGPAAASGGTHAGRRLNLMPELNRFA
jgi:hypothetical protein